VDAYKKLFQEKEERRKAHEQAKSHAQSKLNSLLSRSKNIQVSYATWDHANNLAIEISEFLDNNIYDDLNYLPELCYYNKYFELYRTFKIEVVSWDNKSFIGEYVNKGDKIIVKLYYKGRFMGQVSTDPDNDITRRLATREDCPLAKVNSEWTDEEKLKWYKENRRKENKKKNNRKIEHNKNNHTRIKRKKYKKRKVINFGSKRIH
jgi:hypothetical protein